jgi:hypothetical protein
MGRTGTLRGARKNSAADVAKALGSVGCMSMALGKAAASSTPPRLEGPNSIGEIAVVDGAMSTQESVAADRSFVRRCQIGVAERGLLNLESPAGFARYMLGKFPSWIC